ncbi:MAG: UPF0175 family protein [Candidatus Altiarchaeota archaeon]|nr:UPF0175 family protein [Candidatus Altiarchaeota archaeon]
MSDMYITLPKLLAKEVETIPKLGVYKSESEFIKEAVKTFLMARGDIRISLAIELYKEGVISLGRMSEITDLGYEEAKELLVSKGVGIRRGSRDMSDLKKGAKKLLEIAK